MPVTSWHFFNYRKDYIALKNHRYVHRGTSKAGCGSTSLSGAKVWVFVFRRKVTWRVGDCIQSIKNHAQYWERWTEEGK